MRPWSSLTVFNYYRVLEQARNHLTRRSPSSSKTTLSSCTGIHKGENGVSYSTMTDPGEGPWGPDASLIFRPNWDPNGRKKNFGGLEPGVWGNVFRGRRMERSVTCLGNGRNYQVVVRTSFNSFTSKTTASNSTFHPINAEINVETLPANTVNDVLR